MAAFIRQMSTVVNGMQEDPVVFRQEQDAALRFVTERLKAAKP